jgi:hypothetical protein
MKPGSADPHADVPFSSSGAVNRSNDGLLGPEKRPRSGRALKAAGRCSRTVNARETARMEDGSALFKFADIPRGN